jgi:small subunit ribosomal protein S16
MVKIRLRRIGAKGRPFYRVVIAESSTGRDGKVVESIGTYDPVAQPKVLKVDEERALHWLRQGAQPSETVAYILNKTGILPKFLEERPKQKKAYSFLNKKISATTAAAPGTAAEGA